MLDIVDKNSLKKLKYNADKKGLDAKIEDVENKISYVSGLVTNAVLIQKPEKLKKNPDHARYVTTIEFNRFSGEIFDSK